MEPSIFKVSALISTIADDKSNSVDASNVAFVLTIFTDESVTLRLDKPDFNSTVTADKSISLESNSTLELPSSVTFVAFTSTSVEFIVVLLVVVLKVSADKSILLVPTRDISVELTLRSEVTTSNTEEDNSILVELRRISPEETSKYEPFLDSR